MEESKNGSKAGRFFTTKTWLILWGIVSTAVVIVCYQVRPSVEFVNEFSTLVNAVNVIGYVLIVGVPVFLPAGIVFGTSNGKEYISALLRSGKNPIDVFLRCLLRIYALILLFSLSVSSVLFYEPLRLGAPSIVYLLPVSIATFIVSLILASIGVIFVMITDELIVSTSMGCALTIGLARLFGWNSWVLWHSVTKNQAILSPSNLVKILASMISDYSPDSHYSFESYRVFGFTATVDSILLVLAFFGSIILIGFIVSIKILQRNVLTWEEDNKLRKTGIWESEHEYKQKIAKIRRRLVKRSSILVSLIIIVLTIATISTNSYASIVIENTTIIFHESPESGERIILGDWYIFSCDVQPTQYGLPNILHDSLQTEDWMTHGCPDDLYVFFSMLNMSTSEFQGLNETERRTQCDFINVTSGCFGRGGAVNLGSYYGPFTYVLKIIAAENETTSGFIYSIINLYQSPTF